MYGLGDGRNRYELNDLLINVEYTVSLLALYCYRDEDTAICVALPFIHDYTDDVLLTDLRHFYKNHLIGRSSSNVVAALWQRNHALWEDT